jgi:hypothetical protein
MFLKLHEFFRIECHFHFNDQKIHYNSISACLNGWMDGGIALEWLKVCFDAQMKEKAAGAP